MNTFFKGAVGFVVAYLVLIVPTYVLPYSGSNSAIVGTISAAAGRGATPQFWLHAWCMSMLVLVTSIRGKAIGKSWLLIFPMLAGFFDLMPGLNFIPLVPTVMHLFALVLGAIGAGTAYAKVDAISINNAVGASPNPKHRLAWEIWAAGSISVLSVAGATSFFSGGKLNSTQAAIPAKVSAGSNMSVAKDADLAKSINLGSAVAAESKLSNSAPLAGSQIAESTLPSTPPTELKKVQNLPPPQRAVKLKDVEGQPIVRYIKIDE